MGRILQPLFIDLNVVDFSTLVLLTISRGALVRNRVESKTDIPKFIVRQEGSKFKKNANNHNIIKLSHWFFFLC
jgi:hypothetical protein